MIRATIPQVSVHRLPARARAVVGRDFAGSGTATTERAIQPSILGPAPRGHDYGALQALPSGAPIQRELEDEIARQVALKDHLFSQARVYGLVNDWSRRISPDPEASATDPERLLRNAAEWIGQGKSDLQVLTPTHDSETRDPPELAYFDQTKLYPQYGGTYPLEATDVDHATLFYRRAGATGGMGPDHVLRLLSPHTRTDDQIASTLIHEVQHDADRSRVGEDFATSASKTFNTYQSEFRAYWIQAPEGTTEGDKLGSASNPASNLRPVTYDGPEGFFMESTDFKNERQEYIFWNLVLSGYNFVAMAYAGLEDFRAMVDAFATPEGGNLLNSVRIDALREALLLCDPSMTEDDEPVRLAIERAAALEDAEKRFLDSGAAKPFDELIDRQLGADVRAWVQIEFLV